MKVEDYQERKVEVAGWPVNLTSYRVGDVFHCKADNVSPGAALARTTGATAGSHARSISLRENSLARRVPAS
jgi:hypothetical protein